MREIRKEAPPPSCRGSYAHRAIAEDLVLLFPAETAAELAGWGFGPYLFFEVTEEVAASLTSGVLQAQTFPALDQGPTDGFRLALAGHLGKGGHKLLHFRALDAQCHPVSIGRK